MMTGGALVSALVARPWMNDLRLNPNELLEEGARGKAWRDVERLTARALEQHEEGHELGSGADPVEQREQDERIELVDQEEGDRRADDRIHHRDAVLHIIELQALEHALRDITDECSEQLQPDDQQEDRIARARCACGRERLGDQQCGSDEHQHQHRTDPAQKRHGRGQQDLQLVLVLVRVESGRVARDRRFEAQVEQPHVADHGNDHLPDAVVVVAQRLDDHRRHHERDRDLDEVQRDVRGDVFQEPQHLQFTVWRRVSVGNFARSPPAPPASKRNIVTEVS